MGKDIESIEIVVESKKEGNRKEVPIKEWIPATVSKITKTKRREDWNDELEFEFNLLEDYKPLRAWGHVTLYISPGSKLYEWACALLNVAELAEGATLKINDLLGKPCYIMQKYKTYKGEICVSQKGNKQAKVVEVKYREAAVEDKTKDVVEDDVKPEIIDAKPAVKKEEKKPAKKTKKAEEAKLPDIEVEEINIDDLDDIVLGE